MKISNNIDNYVTAKGPTCPCGFPHLERHTGNRWHGDVCRDGVCPHCRESWMCPIGCEYARKKNEPYCVMLGTHQPCRAHSGGKI